MALPDLTCKLTYEDYLLFPDDGLRHELLDGEHYVTASPFVRHQDVLGNLYAVLRSFVRTHRLGKIYFAPTDVVLSPHDVVVPDLFFVSRERMGIVREKNIQGAPDLIIEILSKRTRRRDEGIKLRTYGRCGVREYWTFDPQRETGRVYRQFGGRLVLASELSEKSETLTSPLFPGLEIPLREVFE
jgi:Uma2 family endonuclease